MSKINLQQVPKVESLMECLQARKGWHFVELDVAALEPTVLASYSKDKTLLELYASGATHDIYLFFAQFIYPDAEVREELRARYKPDPETIEQLKKDFKKVRGLIKVATLGFNYGAQPGKLQLMYKGEGIDVSFDACTQIYHNYWQLLSGVKRFEGELRTELQARKGYILDGFGLPRVIPPELRKDTLNRFVQSTGHGVLLRFLLHISRLRKERGVRMLPVVPDLHDETIWQAPKNEVQAAVQVFKDALAATNKELTSGNDHVPFSGGVETSNTFTKFKLGVGE